ARQNSMPSDNIDRAIKKGTGELEGVTYYEITYEGYGPGGAAVLVMGLTDNRNRAVAELRRLFTKDGGSTGEAGGVGWMFNKKGVLAVEKQHSDEDRLIELALEAGADDVSDDDGTYQITTPPDAFEAVKDALDRAKIPVANAAVSMVPQ